MHKHEVQLMFVLRLILFAAACPPNPPKGSVCDVDRGKRDMHDRADPAFSRGQPDRGKFSMLQRAVL